MALEIELTVSQTTLTMLDDSPLTVKLTNAGEEPILLVDAANPNIPPIFRLTHRETGETLTSFQTFRPGVVSSFPTALAPRGSVTWKSTLLKNVKIKEPGHYDLVAEVPWNQGQGTAKSQPVALTVTGIVPLKMALAGIESPFNTICTAFWTESAEAMLHRTTILTRDQPKIMSDAEVEKLGAGADLLVSDPFNLQSGDDRWVAWLDHKTLHAQFVNGDGQSAPAQSVELPDLHVELMHNPLVMGTLGVEIALWLAAPAAGRAKLQLVTAEPKRDLRAGNDIFLPLPDAPLWDQTAYLSSKERVLYLAGSVGKSWRLYRTSWNDQREFKPVTQLIELEGKFAGAGISLMPDDSVAGVLVHQTGADGSVLELIPWTQTSNGKFEAAPAVTTPNPAIKGVDVIVARVDQSKRPHVLLKSLDGQWFYRGPEGAFAAVGGEAGQAKGSVGLLFSGMQTPIIVYTKAQFGLMFADPMGNFPGKVYL